MELVKVDELGLGTRQLGTWELIEGKTLLLLGKNKKWAGRGVVKVR